MCTAAIHYQMEVYMWLSPCRPRGTNKLHEVAQMPIIFTPITMPSAAKYVPIASWGVPYDKLTEEEKTTAWFTDGSTHYAGTI